MTRRTRLLARSCSVLAVVAATFLLSVAAPGRATAASPGPTIVLNGSADAFVGIPFTVTVSTVAPVPTAYDSFHITLVYDSSVVTAISAMVPSAPAGPFPGGAMICGNEWINYDIGGVLTPPLQSVFTDCLSTAGPTTDVGVISSIRFLPIAPGNVDLHLYTVGPPDNGATYFGTLTWSNATNTELDSPLACGGLVCGSVIGLPAADLILGGTDADGDGYSDLHENAIGHEPALYCAIMRADVNMDGTVNVLDASLVAGKYMQATPPAPVRYDQNADGHINILDISRIASVFHQSISACP